MKSNIFNFLSNLEYQTGALALIDPDFKNNDKIDIIMESVNLSGFDAVLVGGSSLHDNNYHDRIQRIKNLTEKPVILFPGSASQVNKSVDAIFYLSLISGRNPKYLIEEQVLSSKQIYDWGMEVIPVGYILVEGGKISAVEEATETSPIKLSDTEKIISHALAGQYLGHKFIFLESGSGAQMHVDSNTIKALKEHLDVPLIVGGGICCCDDVKDIKVSNPDFIVIGNLLESNQDISFVKEMVDLIHE